MLERITYLNAKRQRRVRVFVYNGAMSSGQCHSKYMRQSYHEAEYISLCTTPGELWVWGGLPFMIPDSSLMSPCEEQTVLGEVYGVDMHTLERLDKLHGIEPTHRATFDWYSHHIVTCSDTLTDGVTSALAYCFQMVPRRIREACFQVPEGDYTNWLLETTDTVGEVHAD